MISGRFDSSSGGRAYFDRSERDVPAAGIHSALAREGWNDPSFLLLTSRGVYSM